MSKPRLSLKQLLGATAVAGLVAWCNANYESWYGVRWTQADAAALAAELANLDGEITEGLAVRIAIDAAATRGGPLRVLPSGVRKSVWTRYFLDGERIDSSGVDCYVVFLEHIPEGFGGAFTRYPGGHCTVYVGLDGSVLNFVGGA